MNIGDKILFLREEKGISQQELADLLEVSRQTISKWECGGSDPEISKILKLSNLFKVSTDYLLGNETDTKNMTSTKNLIIANESKGIKEVIYISKDEIVVITTNGEKTNFYLNEISGNQQSFIENIISSRNDIISEKDKKQKLIDNYLKKNPNCGCDFKIGHTYDFSKNGNFYIYVRNIEPVNDCVTIPNICESFTPSYVKRDSTLKILVEQGTKLKKVDKMFSGICVHTLDLSEFNVSCLINNGPLFANLKVDTLNVLDWDISKMANNSLETLFAYVNANNIIGLESWDTSTVKDFRQLFYKATINFLCISNWDLSSMQTKQVGNHYMSSKIFLQSNLGSIDLSKWKVSNIKRFIAWFNSCKIKSIGDISNWNVSECIDFNSMFLKAKFEETVDVTNWKISCNSNTSNMFEGSNVVTK